METTKTHRLQMTMLKNTACLLALVLIAGCALVGGEGSGTSQHGVSWSGSQNLQIGNNTGKK
jgi:hypothetical protein